MCSKDLLIFNFIYIFANCYLWFVIPLSLTDPDDPEYVRQMRRPAEVKEDMQQMSERLRVSKILQSQAFRDELEQMIEVMHWNLDCPIDNEPAVQC